MVLAESQPLTDTQIQQTLLREMAGLSCTAMDTDNEPCSPTRLLYNIERQVSYNTHTHRVKGGCCSSVTLRGLNKLIMGCTLMQNSRLFLNPVGTQSAEKDTRGIDPDASCLVCCMDILLQSAQLSQFVNSLMPPLSFSPVKQPQGCKRPKAFLR